MFQKAITVLLGIVGLIVADQPTPPNPPGMNDDLTLMDLMIRQSKSGENLECFSLYLPMLSDIDSQYKIDYSKCWTDHQFRVNRTEDFYRKPRDNLGYTAQDICRPLLNCDQEWIQTQNVFECYDKVGTNKSTPLINLSLDGGQLAREIAEEYRQIEIIAETCYSQAYRTYSNDRNDAQLKLDDCLENGLKQSSPTSTTPDYNITS